MIQLRQHTYTFNQFVALFLGHPVDVNALLVIKEVCYLPTTLKSLLAGWAVCW